MSWRARLSTNLQELRVHFCPVSPQSAGVRAWVTDNYAELKALNPRLPILCREAKDVEPVIWARYDYGNERKISVSDLKGEQIDSHLMKLVLQGDKMPKSQESVAKHTDIIGRGEPDFRRNWEPTWI